MFDVEEAVPVRDVLDIECSVLFFETYIYKKNNVLNFILRKAI